MGLMALLSGAKASLKVVTVGADIAKQTTDGIISGLDKIKYTDEEKADTKILAGKAIISSYDRFSKENGQQSRARRDIAWAFVYLYAGFCLQGCLYIALWDLAKINLLIKFAGVMGLNLIMGSIIVTYFTPYQLSRLGILGARKPKEDKP